MSVAPKKGVDSDLAEERIKVGHQLRSPLATADSVVCVVESLSWVLCSRE